jgi:hypothetical protein
MCGSIACSLTKQPNISAEPYALSAASALV